MCCYTAVYINDAQARLLGYQSEGEVPWEQRVVPGLPPRCQRYIVQQAVLVLRKDEVFQPVVRIRKHLMKLSP